MTLHDYILVTHLTQAGHVHILSVAHYSSLALEASLSWLCPVRTAHAE